MTLILQKECQSCDNFFECHRSWQDTYGYSTITEPLRNITRKEQKWHWTKVQENAFNKLKDFLDYFVPNKKTDVDASPS